MAKIYLDDNASTPIDPTVAAAMRPFLSKAFGNRSSGHWAAAPAKFAVEPFDFQFGLSKCRGTMAPR